MMQSTGIMFMAKTKPLASVAADGTFQLTVMAYDRIGSHTTTPWHITYTGPDAQDFWDDAKTRLQTPGQPLLVKAQRMLAHSVNSFVVPEVRAIATSMALAPYAHEAKNASQSTQNVREQLST